MIWILFGIIIVLFIIIVIQFQVKRGIDRELIYLARKLNSVNQENSDEKLLLVTDNKALQVLLTEINEVLNDKQKLGAQFARTEISIKKMLANISHDLKTPLTVVLGYIETIEHDPAMDGFERKRLLANIHRKTIEIIKQMNTFFDLAKLESGDKEVPLTKIHLNEICKKTILAFYDSVQAKGIEADINIPDNPIYVLANEEALDRILHNLLSNALNYGADGKVIGLSLECVNNDIFIKVWDKGKGIEEQNQDRVFERLFTLEESRNKMFQGSGIGLTITKRLVEAIGGEITLKSRPFEKTVFTIKLKKLIY
ncbi:sensor histidine kinase [Metabacillus fastidiosus]|uniref:sensor histidine kinase n=1 Tax=Metabacillus fastidiosus TaxID=1458 RepID=UPI000826B1B0|nr:sensor histidine kinase [Metabacillus fastidiosus]MED4455742.1 sensor histidine kinase [Metabacillus fastidiosus]MED4464596.1 sensor histidine kinase [Metabacillus fastidiosus]